MNTYSSHKTGEIIGPGKGNVDVSERIFHNQSPADNPGNQFAKTGVGISISTSCCRDSAGKFGIAKCSKSTGKTTNQI